MNDTIKVKGLFRLKVIANDGTILEEYEDNNLVVNLGREIIAKRLGGGSSETLLKISVGTGTAAPLIGDTAITSPFTKNVNTVSYPTVGTVQLDWSIETSEANGKAITEFGILTNSNTLFARKTRAVINKDNTFRLEGIWQFIF